MVERGSFRPPTHVNIDMLETAKAKVPCTQNMRFGECAVCDRRSHGAGLDGMYDGGHGADQLPESLDWLGFAGDLDAGV